MADFKKFFRKFGLRISKSIITILIVLAVGSYAVAQITTPTFINPIIQESIVQQVQGAEFDQVYDQMLLECSSKQIVTIPLEQFSKTLKFNCTDVRSGGKENFTALFAGAATESLLGDVYNSNPCSGYDCIALFQNTQDPLQKISAIMNANFNRFISNLGTYFIIGALICAILILLLAEGLPAKLTGLGYPLTISGLPYFAMGFSRGRLSDLLPARALFAVDGIINALSNAFLVMLVLGVVLLISGFVAKFMLNKKAKELGSSNGKKKK